MAKKIKKMPSKIKVGYFDYIVKENKDLVTDMGQIKLDKLLIEVDTCYPDQIVKETLLHECLHAVLKDTFIFNDEVEEKLVTMISPMLMSLIVDNPELKSYLFD